MSTTKPVEEQQNTIVGTAIAESNCQKAVAIFPVRYAVIPSEKSFKDLPALLDKKLPRLENAEYILRTLRPESYVYVYNENSQLALSCFFTQKNTKAQALHAFIM